MIESLPEPQAASGWCARRRRLGQRVGFVPTMGALHDGHLSLVARAVRENDCVCASVFVNPLQFDARDDLLGYPRDWAGDVRLLDGVGCDMVFTGTAAQFFPGVDVERAAPAPSGWSVAMEGLEGEFRRGHLQGVWCVVERLLMTVGACSVYVGEKDFQQALLITDLARRFEGVRVVVCETVREESGLAMSSRNRRLTAAQLVDAGRLYGALLAARGAWRRGVRGVGELEGVMVGGLGGGGIEVEYAVVRDGGRWGVVGGDGGWVEARGLVAGWVGGVRLIDNLRLG